MIYDSDTRTNVEIFFSCIPEKKNHREFIYCYPEVVKWRQYEIVNRLLRLYDSFFCNFFSFIKIVSLIFDSWIVIARENINVNGEQTAFFPLYMKCCSDQHSSHCERRSFQSMPLSPPPTPEKKSKLDKIWNIHVAHVFLLDFLSL